MCKSFHHRSLPDRHSDDQEIVQELRPFPIERSKRDKHSRMSEEEFLLSGACIHHIFKETAKRDLKLRDRRPVVTATPDKDKADNGQNAKTYKKSQANLDRAEFLDKGNKILIGCHSFSKEWEFLDVDNGNQNQRQHKSRFDATEIFHFQKETDITQKTADETGSDQRKDPTTPKDHD